MHIFNRFLPTFYIIASLSVTSNSLLVADITIFSHSGGHPGVTLSLTEGFKTLNIPFSFNPKSNINETVIILAGIDFLRNAIALKQIGKIKKIIAGPNIITRSDENNGIIASPEVDICVVPSEWVQIAYEEETPWIKGKIKTWFAGVDHMYWQPTNQIKKDILIYWKTESIEFYQQVENLVKKYGLNLITIKYGQYSKQQYKALLDQSLCAIFISISESQGLALAEAWSMNVPTLVWNCGALTAHGRVYSTVSSAPYLTNQTGRFWKEFSELDTFLGNISTIVNGCSARKWILDNLTYVHSARKILDIIETNNK